MGACDAGRCCKGSACTDDKKCCCQAKSGNFAVGEVCRTASCNTGGSCFHNVPVCECLAGGGSLTQSCDPCDGVACDKCQQCVNGVCVSTCGICQVCDTSSINGTCVPKTCVPACGQCQECRCFNGQTSCVVVGVICGAGCCALNECCVDGACVSCDCSGQVKPGPCYECVNGSYVPILGTPCVTLCCTPGLACCNGVCCPDGQFCSNNHCCPTGQKWCGSACKECCNNGDCPSGKVCSNGVCVTPSCCIEVPACAPQSISTRSPCENYTFDFMGDPCTVTAIPVNCSSSQCAYTWDGVAWAFDGCAIITSQGPILVATATPGCGCTGAGCVSPSSLSPGSTEGERRYVGNCADVSNPLP